jgi:uncharacterized protein YjbI with pentapeptide repeats
VPEGADLRAIPLTGEKLIQATLTRADLAGAELSNVDLTEANLRGASLTGARLVGAILNRADPTGVSALGADFSLVEADECRVEEADLASAILRQSTWTRSRWGGTRLNGADVTSWIILGCEGLSPSPRKLRVHSPNLAVTMNFGAGYVDSLAWSPDGRRLAGVGDGAVWLWDADSGRALARLEGPEGWVQAVAWSPDGRRIVVGARGMQVWDVESRDLLYVIEEAEDGRLIRSREGFCRLDGPSRLFRLRVQQPEQPGSVLFLPLGGLRPAIDRPDRVEAELTGDAPGGGLRDELARRGWDDSEPWDGEIWRVESGEPAPIALPEASPRIEHEVNRFRPGPALVGVATPPGREPVIQELLDLVACRSPVVLRGPRRSGKTTILNALVAQLAGRALRHATLEGAKVRTADDLARLLEPTLQDDPSPAESFRRRVREEDRPVLLLDEVVHLTTAEVEMLAWLRAIGQAEASIVMAGSHWDWVRVVEHAATLPVSSFGNDVTPVDLGEMAIQDAVAFLVATAKDQDIPLEADKTAAWITELCGGWPFYLQVMGHAVVQAVQSGRRKALVDREGVLDLYDDRLLLGRAPAFRGRWDELPPPARTTLLGMTGSRPPPYTSLAPDQRKAVRDTGLCTSTGRWLKDRPFYDWVLQNSHDLRDNL